MKPMIVVNDTKFGNDFLNLHIILFLITFCSPLKAFTHNEWVQDENGQFKKQCRFTLQSIFCSATA